MDCECGADDGSIEGASVMTQRCMSEKILFTANLMAYRMICDNLQNKLLMTVTHLPTLNKLNKLRENKLITKIKVK